MNYAKAFTKFVRISPRKARLIAGLIKGQFVEEAKLQLAICQHKGSRLLAKTLQSAVANAETLFDARKENLIVHEVRVDAGPSLKRAKPRSKGSQHPILKRTSHFTVVVATEENKE